MRTETSRRSRQSRREAGHLVRELPWMRVASRAGLCLIFRQNSGRKPMPVRAPFAVVAAIALQAVLVSGTAGAPAGPKPSLDYEFFKGRVEPIFLEKRAGHPRCYVCHAESNNNLRLEKLPSGASLWSEDQSRRN